MSRHSLTKPVGTTMQSTRFHITTDADRDRYVSQALATDTAGAITRPSGEARDRHRPDPQPGEMTGWSARQTAAANHLKMLWRAALPIRGMPAGYSDWRRFTDRGRDTNENPEVAQEAWDDYCKAMDELARCTSTAHANAVKAAIVFEDPPTLPRAYLVREGLSFLVTWWKLR
jgi:hypothetical protein